MCVCVCVCVCASEENKSGFPTVLSLPIVPFPELLGLISNLSFFNTESVATLTGPRTPWWVFLYAIAIFSASAKTGNETLAIVCVALPSLVVNAFFA